MVHLGAFFNQKEKGKLCVLVYNTKNPRGPFIEAGGPPSTLKAIHLTRVLADLLGFFMFFSWKKGPTPGKERRKSTIFLGQTIFFENVGRKPVGQKGNLFPTTEVPVFTRRCDPVFHCWVSRDLCIGDNWGFQTLPFKSAAPCLLKASTKG